MSLQKFLSLLVLTTPLVLAGTRAVAQQTDYTKVEVKAEKVADNIYMLTGAGGNVGLSVGRDGALLIDDQFAPLAPKIRAAVALLSDQPIRFLINTHWHGDHAGGNEAFGKTGSVIVAQDNVRNRLNSTQPGPMGGPDSPPAPAAALPVVTYADAVTLHFNDDDLDMTHVANAHTDGDTIIRFRKANVIHMGDTFFLGSYPFIDNKSGGSYDGMIAAIEKGLALADDNTRIIPGHGPLGNKKDLQEFHDMLVAIRARVVKLVQAGKTQDEVIAAKPTADYDAKLPGSFFKPDVWVARVYVEYRKAWEAKQKGGKGK